MELLNINILWNLFWILPLFLILAIIASKKRKKYLTMILGKRYSDPEHVNLSNNKRTFRLWVLAIIIIFLTIAAARPYWGYRLLPFSGSGRDILAVIDVSKSMLAKDIQPSRLAHAKLLLKNLIRNTPGDRYGIIAFAGSAFLECPLTIDRTSLFSILKDINVDSIPVGGTNIEKALNVAINAFKAAAGGYKAIILITDGDELQGSSSNVINTLKEIKTPLLVVGIGDPAKPGLIRLPAKEGESKYLRDSKGDYVKSRLNETQLKQLAKSTNGIYIRSTAVDPGLNILEKKIAQLIPEKYENGKMTRPLEKFQIPLFFAVLFIFIWLAVGELNRKRNGAIDNRKKKKFSNNRPKTIMLLSGFILIGSNHLQADPNDNPIDQLPIASSPATSKKQSEVSEVSTKDAPEISKTPIEMFNMGVKAHKKGDLKSAGKHYTEAINLANKKRDIRSKAYQNMGVIQHAAARKIMEKNPQQSLQILSKAESLYKEAMRRGSSRKEVAANQQILLNDRKKTKEIIKRRKEMQKKRDEARKKTQEALNKQKQANKNKDQKQDKQKKQEQKQDKQKQQDKKQEQDKQQNKQQGQDKQNQQQQDKQKQNKEQQEQNNEQQQRESNRKTQEAQKAVQDYKESAKQNKSQKDMQAAQSASDDIKNARKNQRQNKTNKAEKNLKEALKKLSGDNKQNQQQNNQQDKQKQQNKEQQKQMQDKKNKAQQKTQDALDKQQQANKSQGKEKEKKQKESNQKTSEAQKAMEDYQKSAKQNNSRQDKQNAEKAAQNLKKAQQNQQKNDGKKAENDLKQALKNLKNNEKDKKNKQDKLPPQPKNQPAQPKYDNKEIDPKQAEALLKLMANEEKSLKEELKKRQKEAYGNMPVDKDW